jgi:predicted transcriptional regulator
MMPLTRQDKEKLVLELYSQGKTYRQIAEEARICPRDIKTILNNVVKERESEKSLSVSSQAYKLFLAGNSPIGVAIALNLRDDQVTELYKEYWNLNNLHDLNQVYEEIKGEISSFVNLYSLSKTAGMNAQHIVKLLTIANNYLPSVEQRYEKLKREEASLQAGNHNSARTLQELSDLISTTQNTLEQYESDCKERRLEIKNLNKECIASQELVNDFQNNNEEFIKIIKTVEDKVLGVLSNAKVLIRNALLSITESMRNNPERYRSIFYNMSSVTDYSGNGQDYMYGQQQQQNSSPDYDTERSRKTLQ